MPGYRKLGRKSDHRKAMLRNLVTDLLREERIVTTKFRAKEAGREAELRRRLEECGLRTALRQSEALAQHPEIETVFIITDSESGYRDMIAGLDVKDSYQLYRDYLDNFRINSVRR